MTAPVDNVPTIEEEEPATPEEAKQEGAKKAISLRVAVADLELARELAEELEIGYQVLLNQLIHDGLADRRQDREYRQLVERFRASITELKAAQDLVSSPAVKAAKELLDSPAIKAAQDLLNAPAVKAAQDAVATQTQKVREFGASAGTKAAEDFAASPLAKAIKDLTTSPAWLAAQDLATGTTAKLQREWEKSPAGRLADAVRLAADPKGDQLAELNRTVKDMQDALKKAGLL
jgi:predicted DNA binding CopG/RHH family protein